MQQNRPIFPKRRLLIVVMCVAISGCGEDFSSAPHESPDISRLGEKLFFDARLSVDGSVSCATCHDPTQSFTDGRTTSIGAAGRVGTRNATSLLDIGDVETFFWDGREADLTSAVLQPLTNEVELGNTNITDVEQTLTSIPEYQVLFLRAFRRPPDKSTIGQSLVAYMQSLKSGTTRLERYLSSGDIDLLSQDERAGLDLFRGKAKCANCHIVNARDAPLTDHKFHHAGIGFERITGRIAPLLGQLDLAEKSGAPLGRIVLENQEAAELGRFVLTRDPMDLGAFRTPTLRNVANTSPYMHDGSVATLEAAIERELYYRGIALGRPISLTVEEQRQLLALLQALSIDP